MTSTFSTFAKKPDFGLKMSNDHQNKSLRGDVIPGKVKRLADPPVLRLQLSSFASINGFLNWTRDHSWHILEDSEW